MTYDKKCVEYSYGMVTTQEYDCIGIWRHFSGGVTMAVAALLASAYGITGSSIYYLIDSYE